MCAVSARFLLELGDKKLVGRCNYGRNFRANSYFYQIDPSSLTIDL